MTQSQLQVAALTCCKGTKSSRDHGPRHSTTWETVQILGCSLGVKSHLETTMMVVECSRIVLYPVGGAVPIPAVTTIAYSIALLYYLQQDRVSGFLFQSRA